MDFPFTAAEVRTDAQRTYVVTAASSAVAASGLAASRLAASRGSLPATGGSSAIAAVAGAVLLACLVIRRRQS